MMTRQLIALFALLITFATTGQASATGEVVSRTWQIDGVAREGIIVRPGPDAKKPPTGWPVVFGFHGHGGNTTQFRRQWAIEKHWPEATVVYLQGLPTKGSLTDPKGNRNGWDLITAPDANKDVRFYDAALKSLVADEGIDARRVFATGHSNGGAFVYLLWSCRADTLAAVAPSASILAGRGSEISPKPALIIAGRNDPLVRYTWQDHMIRRVLKTNACATDSEPWFTVGQRYTSTASAPTVLIVHDGAHAPPPDAGKLVATFFRTLGQKNH
jgi:polyhydroxybutyrate depolymerase